ncbi:MAG: hypothetical protein BWZ07_02764 [Alphaproteobacteria bacterium ADurb.BinA280]|nr:MAG: hypothetical protein BWZ07_02764 [Alphaproteobacteria bacterium ADurb.BinA280]
MSRWHLHIPRCQPVDGLEFGTAGVSERSCLTTQGGQYGNLRRQIAGRPTDQNLRLIRRQLERLDAIQSGQFGQLIFAEIESIDLVITRPGAIAQ